MVHAAPGKQFVEVQTGIAGEIVGSTRTGGVREVAETAGSIRQAPAGDVFVLCRITCRLEGVPPGVGEGQDGALREQSEVEVGGTRLLVGPQAGESARGEKGQGPVAEGGRPVVEVEIAQGHRVVGVLVENLEPVALTGNPVGEPFVDGELALGGHGHGRVVGRPRTGLGQLPLVPPPAEREVGNLQTEREGINAITGRVRQEERPALRGKPEART